MNHRLYALLVCMLGVCVLGSAAVAAQDVRGELTRGVRQIAAPGVPGPLVVWGKDATVVCVAQSGKKTVLPVVAAAAMGKGRVVAFGHTGYLDAGALEVGDTGVLIDNAVRWAGGGAKGPRVGVINNAGFANALLARGVAATALGKSWENDLAGIDVVCSGQGALSAEQERALRGHVSGGGGLLYAGLGWGWLQVTHSSDIREHPGSRLLRECGIAWSEGTLQKDSEGGFSVADALPAAAHAGIALEALERGDAGEDLEQAAAVLTDAVRTLPADEPVLIRRCRGLLEKKSPAITPGPKSPLRAKQGLERALLALEVEMERDLPADKVKAHPAVALFPGPLPANAPRIFREFEIDRTIPGWHSTGLYAPPGETIVVATAHHLDLRGCGVRIGCHTDHLWHLDQWQRVPDISRHWDLGPINHIASPFGGLIYIEVGASAAPHNNPGSDNSVLHVTISGAAQAPRFVLGETTREQWQQSRSAPAPWAELETRKIIIAVPSSSIRTLDDPDALMLFWDKISDAHATLAAIPLERARPERYVADVQISAGYMHSGYPIMTHLDAADAMTSLEKLRMGSWGLLHELGHNHQSGDWTFEGTGEVTCNLFALHAIDTICTPGEHHRGHDAVDSPPDVRAYMVRGAMFDEWKKQPFLALQMYVQMQKAFGWEPFKQVFAEYRGLTPEARPKTDDAKRDQWLVRFSRACGHNLGPFFEKWGVPTSEAARRSIVELPGWMPEELRDDASGK